MNASVSESNSYTRTSYDAFTPVRTKQWALDYAYETDAFKTTLAVYQKREDYANLLQRSVGAELYLKRIYRKWQFEVSYSMNRGQVYTDSLSRYPSDYNLPFFIKNTVQWELPFLTLGTTLSYRSGTPFTPVAYGLEHPQSTVFEPVYRTPNSGVLPTYFRTDLLLSKYLVSKKGSTAWTIYLTIGNVFDTENIRSYAYNFDYSTAQPAAFQRRTVYTGLVYSFK